MKKFYFLLPVLTILTGIISCNSPEKSKIGVVAPQGFTGNVIITDITTEQIIAELSPGEALKEIALETPIAGSATLVGREDSYLLALLPGREINLSILPDSSIVSDSKSDSLLNYLWKSNNTFVREHQGDIFGNSDVLLSAFDRFGESRDSLIDASDLTSEENAFLKFQNRARINGFLFHVGRIMKQLPPEDPFFEFADDIDPENKYIKTLPANVLFKYELDYLQRHDSIRSIRSFNNFIEEQALDEDLTEFFKAFYLSELILNPSYWEKHAALFDSQILREEIEREQGNRYSHLYEVSSSKIFSTRAGEMAPDFTAMTLDGKEVHLSDLKGKVVYIDNWATWCLRCLQHRPGVLELAEKFREQPDVQVLMVSLDQSERSWTAFLNKGNKTESALDLRVEEAFDSDYSKQYNINFLPKYILIGKDGKIIDANIGEPSLRVEERILEALEK